MSTVTAYDEYIADLARKKSPDARFSIFERTGNTYKFEFASGKTWRLDFDKWIPVEDDPVRLAGNAR